MKFTCNTKDLVSAVQTATRVIASHSPIALLEGILLDADENGLTLTASDGNMTSVTKIPAEIETDGSAVLPGRLLSDIARKLPDGTVSASLSNRFVLTLRCGGSRTNISGVCADSYPVPERIDAEYELSLPQPMLKDMINTVSFAVPEEDARKVLTGGYLNAEYGLMDLVGLDGYRMAMRTQRISDEDKNAKAIIPARALDEIARMMGDDEEETARLCFGKNRILIETKNTSLYSALIDGTYIDYKRVVPRSFETTAIVSREMFNSCIDLASTIAREGKGNLVRFDVGEECIVISSNSENGDQRTELPAEVTGSAVSISFNVKYMSELTRVMSGERIALHFNKDVNPCVITPAEGDSFTYLVLPVRTNA